jgi:hypothetical protein
MLTQTEAFHKKAGLEAAVAQMEESLRLMPWMAGNPEFERQLQGYRDQLNAINVIPTQIDIDGELSRVLDTIYEVELADLYTAYGEAIDNVDEQLAMIAIRLKEIDKIDPLGQLSGSNGKNAVEALKAVQK